MFSTYLKTAFRNLSENKVFAFINIMGPCAGTCVCPATVDLEIPPVQVAGYWLNTAAHQPQSGNAALTGLVNSFARNNQNNNR